MDRLGRGRLVAWVGLVLGLLPFTPIVGAINAFGMVSTACSLVGFADAQCSPRALRDLALSYSSWAPAFMLCGLVIFAFSLRKLTKLQIDDATRQFADRMADLDASYRELHASNVVLQATVGQLPRREQFEQAIADAQILGAAERNFEAEKIQQKTAFEEQVAAIMHEIDERFKRMGVDWMGPG